MTEPDAEEIRDLVERYLLDALSHEESERFKDLLRRNEEALQALIAASRREVAMHRAMKILAEEGAASGEDVREERGPAPRPISPTKWQWMAWVGMAAGVVLLATLVGLFMVKNQRKVFTGLDEGPGPAVRKLQWTIEGPVTAVSQVPGEEGEALLAEGSVTITFTEGSEIRLARGSLLQLPRPTREGSPATGLKLLRGTALVHVAKSAGGEVFVLSTPAGNLRVEGTRFWVQSERKERPMNEKIGRAWTRVIVLIGALTLVNPLGSIGLQAGDVALAEEGAAPQKAVEGLMARFGGHYEPVPVSVNPAIPPYSLPLKKSEIGNYDFVKEKIASGGPLDESLLLKNGFAGMPWGGDDFIKMYKALREKELPIYVTSDSVLHLYHLQFDDLLMRIEMMDFIPALEGLLAALVDHVKSERDRLGEGFPRDAADKALAFCAVGLEMLTDTSVECRRLKGVREKVVRSEKSTYNDLIGLVWTDQALIFSFASAPEFQDRRHPLNPRNAPRGKAKEAFLKYLDLVIARREKAKRCVDLPAPVRRWVDQDLTASANLTGFQPSGIFTYEEDFSQYLPRGHYTRTFPLMRYFRAMMWLGRMTFLVKGGNPYGPTEAYLVSPEEARRQTMAACILTKALQEISVEGRPAREIWEHLYGITSFFVGLSDDLGHPEYHHAFTEALGKGYGPAMLSQEKKALKVKAELVKLRKPAIYSGTGQSMTLDPAALAGVPSPEVLNKALHKTQGYRFMGQRFVPDSYAMGKLVYPSVGIYIGEPPPGRAFTGGRMRSFPRGLDVMALLGSKRAKTLLDADEDSAYEGYETVFQKLAGEFAEIADPEGWNINLYWSWLYTLKGLVDERSSAGMQPYMGTKAWLDKTLNTALGSWAQLRHDTILYVKQAYTMKGKGEHRIKEFPGYVEPVPHFYARLLALTRLTLRVLEPVEALDANTRKRLAQTEVLLERLLQIAVKELENKPLSAEDVKWIKHFDRAIKAAVVGFSQEPMKTTLIADVHTDTNSGKVLEVGTGPLAALVVANRLPDGSIGLAVGPVFTFYEFKHPMSDRLTDEKWRALLRKGDGLLADKMPRFVESYFSGR
ncbi:MAG: DUF3160 domain-containing protein [Planctomycetota bacterium]